MFSTHALIAAALTSARGPLNAVRLRDRGLPAGAR
jgi:hypothetical protein